jgi:hypothetical protein
MLYDPTATDACFVDGRPPKELKETIEWARSQLGLDGDRPWRLISARTKLGRTLFEVEEEHDGIPRRLIGKLGRTERAAVLYRTLTALREAGFKPPARMTVPEPVAFISERGFVLQEKIRGNPANDLLLGAGRASFAAADCARWLSALHQCDVTAPPSGAIDTAPASQWVRDLAAALPNEAARLEKIGAAILREATAPVAKTVPCHGDFHPMNIFILGTQHVTGIDIDKFGSREPESDIGWFLMQTSAFGFFKTASFESTARARQCFIDCYEAETGQNIRPNRAGLHMAMAFLKNLHFELVLLKTGRTEYAHPWINGAEAAILEENIYLSESS